MIKKSKKFLINFFKSFLINYKKPKYSAFLYDFSRQYVNYYRGDQNADMETNGEEMFLRKILKKGMVVFDVGSNIGEYAVRIKAICPSATIHCFEPNKEVLDKNPLDEGVVKNNVALSDSIGERELFDNQDDPGLTSFYNMKEGVSSAYKNLRPYSVRTDTLDSYCKKNKVSRIDLLKIDVEGHEMSVLKGGERMIKERRIEIVQFEFGYASLYARTFLKDFLEYFDRFGYEVYKIKPLLIEKVIYSPEEERCSYANFLAIKKKKTPTGEVDCVSHKDKYL